MRYQHGCRNTGLRFCVDYKGEYNEYVYVCCTQREGCLGCSTINEIIIMEKFTSRINQIKFVTYGLWRILWRRLTLSGEDTESDFVLNTGIYDIQ
jgi:hypothetical protein